MTLRSKKQVVLPRAQSHHLDDLTDPEVEDWFRRWANLETVKTQCPKVVPVKEPGILEHVDGFMTYLEKNEGRHSNGRR